MREMLNKVLNVKKKKPFLLTNVRLTQLNNLSLKLFIIAMLFKKSKRFFFD